MKQTYSLCFTNLFHLLGDFLYILPKRSKIFFKLKIFHNFICVMGLKNFKLCIIIVYGEFLFYENDIKLV